MDRGILYLGRISHYKEYEENGVKCFSITLSDKFDKYMECLKGLAPSKELYNWHLQNKDRENFNDGYYTLYFNQIKSSVVAQNDLKVITDLLVEGKDVALICFCDTYKRCHRSIIGGWFEKKGFDVIYR